MQTFHISATGRSLNYLPEYVAVDQGFFEEEGLRVTAEVPSPWDRVLDDIGTGKAQAALGGIWVPSMFHGRGKRYVPFAQVAARAPLAIVGRERPEDFEWSALAGRTVSMKGSNGASVGLFIKMLLRENGVDPKAVNFVQDLDGRMLTDLFSGGMGDYLVIDFPSAVTLEAAGGGHVVQPLPVTGGNIPWSVYYSEGEPDEERRETHTRFARALGRGMNWILDHEAEDYRAFLAATFPRFAPDLLVKLTDIYRANGMWTTPRIDNGAYQRWQVGICDGHLTDAPIPYGALIDQRPTAA
ncbi:MAG: nitrate ABC transporter substrate-binding protein [Martelella sp.]|uniref:ABC transporter substrate-binding protein n=1 Tax=unclassified Martelella TaxID=2629616 RepID=UPI000C4FCD93|nr:ABC transporter substrate-binding protein [Martelella sp.]MAU23239.1 nitrate ABC transporter substrate-binding protein [Martelella sp.]